jgi:Uma2 family endonuclease
MMARAIRLAKCWSAHLSHSAEGTYRMHMATKTQHWTRADLERLPDDGNRYEVLDGELFVTPLPLLPHQWIATQLLYRLVPYVRRYRLGVVVGPGSVVVGEDEVQPDIAVFPVDPRKAPAKWDRLPRPILVTEVLSRTTRRRDLEFKKKAYRRWRIPTYWVIDRFEREAIIWTPRSAEPVIATNELRWRPRAGIKPLVIPLVDILPPASLLNE